MAPDIKLQYSDPENFGRHFHYNVNLIHWHKLLQMPPVDRMNLEREHQK